MNAILKNYQQPNGLDQVKNILAKYQLNAAYEYYLSGQNGVKNQYTEDPELEGLKQFSPGAVFRVFNKIGRGDIGAATEKIVTQISKEWPSPEHRKFTRYVECKNFKPQFLSFGVNSITLDKGNPYSRVNEDGEYPNANPDCDTEFPFLEVKRSGLIQNISEEALTNDPAWVRTFAQAMHNALQQMENDAAYDTLQTNPILPGDNMPVFIDGKNSKDAPGAFSLPELLKLFRGQTYERSGKLVQAEPRFLIIPADLESAANEQLFKTSSNLTLFVRSGLKAAFLLADPFKRPTLCRGALGEKPEYVSFGRARISNGGAEVRGETHFDFAWASRYGAARMLLS